jgi:CheY-like chemotaxis protein/nitrogen-specific signal transduction histidine kinase
VELKNREVEQAKAALEEKAEQLALSSRYKSEFLANMSHELRTPLNSLLILGRLLTENTEGNLTKKQVEFAQTIYTSGTDLLSLINDILDLAKIESGTVTLNIASERLSYLCEYVDRTFRQLAHDKGLEFRISVDARVPQVIETDGKRLQQIIKNLLSNAVKFTEKGEVTLRIEPATSSLTEGNTALGAAGAVVAFSVIDTGIGIPMNKQQLIFEAFQQADGSTSREYGGTGLGLSICRELARLLGGEIRLASELGKGSVFTLYLPVANHLDAETRSVASVLEAHSAREMPARNALLAASNRAEVQPIPADVITGLAAKKALLVDDDIRNAFALTSALEQYGMIVTYAGSGKDAIDMLKRVSDVDCVLMDVMMPDLDGYDTMRIMRQIEKYRALPIIALTAKAMVGDREKCLAAGATDYIAKPASLEHLLTLLWRHLKQ